MQLDPKICERARRSRDARFDGRFFVGVKTTGVYCRPICPVRLPKAENVTFYRTAAAAAEEGFRPCLRCRPELSAGMPDPGAKSETVRRALRLLDAGEADEGGVARLATLVGVTPRHLGRLFRQELGASPLSVMNTRRLHFAKRLVDETELSMSRIAFASGFGSVRRFNATFRDSYGRTPTRVRDLARRSGVRGTDRPTPRDEPTFRFELAFRPPLAWQAFLDFVGPRCTPGVERVFGDAYERTFGSSGNPGTVRFRPVAGRSALELTVVSGDPGDLLTVVERAKRLCDLGAEPDAIDGVLRRDPVLRSLVGDAPGLRLPGAWSGFEVAVRAILGQQVTVAGATTLAGRLADRFGEPIEPPAPLGRLFPTPGRLAEEDLTEIGLPGRRAEAVSRLAREVVEGRLALHVGADPEVAHEALLRIPGVGEWTARYVRMRALADPDAFPSTDLALLDALGMERGRAGASALESRAEAWRPWRAYAALHLWRNRRRQLTSTTGAVS